MNRIFRHNALPLITLLLAATLLLGGCGGLLRSTYSRPEVSIPSRWQEAKVTGTVVATRDRWWRDFNDPTLSELIERALRSNNDLAAAAIRVRRAQLTARLTDTNLTPSVSVRADGSISSDLKNHVTTRSSGVTGTVSYEADLWGKLARARDAGHWEAEATESDRQSTALALVGTVAANYWQIAYLNERIATVEASIAYAEKILELVEVKYRAGSVSSLDKVQARQTVASQKAQLTELLQQRTEARNALAILFDQAPENKMPELQRLPYGELPAVNTGLPASLLAQRPDLRAAEKRLREYLANVDSTRASYYPTFTLTGTLGTGSNSLVEFLKNPYAALGAALTLPFIQLNTMKLNVEISKTEYEEAVVNFRQTLYSALSDVENALSARTYYAEESKQLEESLALARKAEQLVEVRYHAGSTALQSWLDAQERRRDAEMALSVVRLSQLKNCMSLYQALGGAMPASSRN
ncbi:MAG TPA: efflux transporter outer membrane subunit [Geobacteraceae bacterium]|nr:efflux transporter outer membrane subunit [Geobacteraceae bacterium]